MGDGEGDNLGDGWVVEQDLVDLARRDLLAAAVDDLFEATCEAEVALVVLRALVAGANPAVGEGVAVGFRIAQVALLK